MEDNVTFDNENLEKIIVSYLLKDITFSNKVIKYLYNNNYKTSSNFINHKNQLIVNITNKWLRKFGTLPNQEEFKIVLNRFDFKEIEEDIKIYTESLIEELYEKDLSGYDKQFFYAETEKLINRNLLQDKLMEVSLAFNGDETDYVYELINEVEKFTLTDEKKSLSVSNDFDEEELDDFFQYEYDIKKVSSGYEELDRTLGGGFKEGKFYAIAGASGGGKSIGLMQFCINGSKEGKKSLFVSLEMDKQTIMERFYTNILPEEYKCFEDVLFSSKTNKKTLYQDIQNSKEKIVGQIDFEFPTELGITAKEIRNMIKDNEYDVIYIDYLGIMASSRNSKEENLHQKYKMIAEELRSIAKEFEIPVITALQLARDGYKTKQLEITDIGYSLGISQTADFIAGIANNGTELHIIKNRDGDKSPLGLDMNYSKFKINNIIKNTDKQIDEVMNKKQDKKTDMFGGTK